MPHLDQFDKAVCPQCTEHAAKKLNRISRDSMVDYYRCDHCGNVWTTRKGTEIPVAAVTETHQFLRR